MCDVGTNHGDSVRAWISGSPSALVSTFDLNDAPQQIAKLQRKRSGPASAQTPEGVRAFFGPNVRFFRGNLLEDAARYWDISPQDCVLYDERGAIWPSDAYVSMELREHPSARVTLKIKAVAAAQSTDEVEVYGTGFLREGIYYTDIIDMGDRAAIGVVDWIEEAIGTPEFSALSVRVRTGLDDTPLVFREFIQGDTPADNAYVEVTREEYVELLPTSRGGIVEDVEHWSPWFAAINGELIAAPNPRRYVQFQLRFRGFFALVTSPADARPP